MPNAPKTPTRTVRVPDELWLAAQKEAAKQGVTVTSVLLDALEKFIAEGLDKVTE
jgi:LDH2 family malate/lactate/ureidoglycolate dehydrogenase